MKTHVTVLGIVHIVFGALGVASALLLMLIFGGAAGIVGATGDADAQFAVPIIGIAGTTLVVFLMALSLPGLVIGIGLLKLRPWARISGIVLSIFDLTFVPVGTIVGIYGLVVLLSKETERLFGGTPAAST